MITTPSPTTTRRYPRKPERTAPVSIQKTVNAESAIDLLNYFVSEARKEIRKRETLTVKGRKSKSDFDELTFVHDNFSITINFKEGIAV